jgi:phosphoribosyl-AMP cyclohydrolase
MITSVVFDELGLVPVIAQDSRTGQVLMVAWMNEEALRETVDTGRAVYFSRSRQKLWRKGEQSGHVQEIKEIRLDCDGDVLLLSVEQVGGIACHTGHAHCFYRKLDENGQWCENEPVLKSPDAIYGSSESGQE